MLYALEHPASTLGLTRKSLGQLAVTLRGDRGVPPTRFDLTSTRIFTPRLSAQIWLGRRPTGRHLPVVNLYNHTQTDPRLGWSVRFTQVRDFRGGQLTYDSHNGTDFAVPPGTPVVASAPGRVVAIRNEYNRGGLKLYVDHGEGLMTTYNHLADTVVPVGADVARGQPVALSGYSGIDAIASLGCVAPHVHFNVIHGGVLVDPFSAGDESPLWQHDDNRPRPPRTVESHFQPTALDPSAVDALVGSCSHDERRARLEAIADPYLRGWQAVIEATTYPTVFEKSAEILFETTPRRERITLPFSADDYDDIVFADDAGYRGR